MLFQFCDFFRSRLDSNSEPGGSREVLVGFSESGYEEIIHQNNIFLDIFKILFFPL